MVFSFYSRLTPRFDRAVVTRPQHRRQI